MYHDKCKGLMGCLAAASLFGLVAVAGQAQGIGGDDLGIDLPSPPEGESVLTAFAATTFGAGDLETDLLFSLTGPIEVGVEVGEDSAMARAEIGSFGVFAQTAPDSFLDIDPGDFPGVPDVPIPAIPTSSVGLASLTDGFVVSSPTAVGSAELNLTLALDGELSLSGPTSGAFVVPFVSVITSDEVDLTVDVDDIDSGAATFVEAFEFLGPDEADIGGATISTLEAGFLLVGAGAGGSPSELLDGDITFTIPIDLEDIITIAFGLFATSSGGSESDFFSSLELTGVSVTQEGVLLSDATVVGTEIGSLFDAVVPTPGSAALLLPAFLFVLRQRRLAEAHS